MCYAIPGKVVDFEDKVAIVDYFGEKRRVLNEFSDVREGDYVYAQGGILVQKIPEKEALSILKEWKRGFFQLKQLDEKLTEKKRIRAGKEFGKIIARAEQGSELKKEELLQVLRCEDKKELNSLFQTANKLRKKYLKNSCCVHGIIEFSNHCRNNCYYCGLRKDNRKLKRYRMSVEEIVKAADFAANKLGFKALVLQSGEDLWYSQEKLTEIIKRIKKKCGVLLFMSVGGRSKTCYKKMYNAGARGVLLRFETSNPELYKKIHSGKKANFKKRIELLRSADQLGYIIATGSLIGLPGQTEKDLVNDILLTKKLNAEMWSFGPLIPHPETPLGKSQVSGLTSALKVIAASRFSSHQAKILVTTALETLDKEKGRKKGLLSGANSLMINVTPEKYRQNYLIYPGRADQGKKMKKNIEETLNLLYSLGRAPTDLGM